MRKGHSEAVRRYLAAGYMTSNQLLEDLGFCGFPQSKRVAVAATFPPPNQVVDGVMLWDTSQCLDILCKNDAEKRFKVLAVRFMVGEFLPRGYEFRGVGRKGLAWTG